MKFNPILMLLSAVLLSVASPITYGEEDLDRQLAEARKALDEAAQRLAELHTSKYDKAPGGNRAMLGILLGDTRASDGVELVGVTPGGGAEIAGLQAGDKIVGLGDVNLREQSSPMKALTKYMKGVKPGEKVDVIFVRDGDQVTSEITTQAESRHMIKMITKSFDDFEVPAPMVPRIPNVVEAVAFGGAGSITTDKFLRVEGDLASYFDVESGVVLLEAPEDSALKAGDVLLSVGDDKITTIPDALMLLGGVDGEASVDIKREGRNRDVTVKGGEFAKMAKEEIRVIRLKEENGDEVHVEVEIND